MPSCTAHYDTKQDVKASLLSLRLRKTEMYRSYHDPLFASTVKVRSVQYER